MTTNTATLIRKLTTGNWQGDARLYHLSPPLAGNVHVIVSANDVMHSGPETYIFPATADGGITDWHELDGSTRGTLSHSEALSNAGYEEVTR